MSRSLHVRNGSMQALVHAHSRFGRGRGNGTGPRTATALGTGRGVGWDAEREKKIWMEPVISSSAGACFAPLLIFRSANMLNTRITAATMLSGVLRLRNLSAVPWLTPRSLRPGHVASSSNYAAMPYLGHAPQFGGIANGRTHQFSCRVF